MSEAAYPDLADRAVIVTGGATGIGADIVRAFAAQGAKVAFLDILKEPGLALVAELKATAAHGPAFFVCDLTDMTELKRTVERVSAKVGPVSILVNNAADDTRHKAEDVTPEFWDHVQSVNLKSQFFMAQAVLPMMKKCGGGSIINLSSIAWRHGPDMFPVYGAAKAGVIGLTYSLARAFGPHNIRVNAIEPGAVMTERQRRLWYPTQESIDVMVARQILQSPLTGADIARMALFLASNEARMITKQSFIVDAGLR